MSDSRVDVTSRNHEAIREAIRFEHKGIVKLLTTDKNRDAVKQLRNTYPLWFD
jgi:hypothetical protein